MTGAGDVLYSPLMEEPGACQETACFAAICRGSQEWQGTAQGAALAERIQSLLSDLKIKTAFDERQALQSIH